MTDVRIRHEDEMKAKPLGTADLTDKALDEVLALLRAWGVRTDDGSYFEDFSGQFVIDDTGAYFEVIVHEAAI